MDRTRVRYLIRIVCSCFGAHLSEITVPKRTKGGNELEFDSNGLSVGVKVTSDEGLFTVECDDQMDAL